MMAREGQGDEIPYAQRVVAYLQVPEERVSSAVIAQLKQELGALLVEAGYPEDPAAGFPRWCAAQAVAPDQLMAQSRQLLEEARRRTHERVHPLPPGHQVAISFPTGYAYRGYSDYARDYSGRVMLNGDIAWEYAQLKHLITHEAFPGHQAFSAIREARYRAGQLPVEATLYFSNTPITPIVEGLCEMGQTILGMVETVDDRIYDVYNRYSTAVSLNLAFDCNADGRDKADAAEQLVRETYTSRLFAERYTGFFTDPLWCTSFPHYWYGAELIRACMVEMADKLPQLFHLIYAEPHTVRTLRLAVQAAVA
jgi:hypothetical protein